MNRNDSWEFVCRFGPGQPAARIWLWRRRDANAAVTVESKLFSTFLDCYGNACAFGFSGGGMNLTAEALDEPRAREYALA
jgi:hypothetical protein